MSLLLATTNPGKVREIRSALEGVPVRLLTLEDLARVPEPDETGATFADNASLKARYYFTKFGMMTVADDSGLVVDALDGRPGVHSARYPGATYSEKYENLFGELAPHPRPWKARFICSLIVVRDGETVFAAEGAVEGEIVLNPRGSNGFGYDPIFFYPPYGRTLADTTDERKLAVSHRGKAFRLLRNWLVDNNQELLGG